MLLGSSENFAAGPFQRNEVLDVLAQVEWEAPPAVKVKENKRAVAAALAILLGPFGGHRLYLGTKSTVPIVYAATLGGGFFILPLIDLGFILFTKDLSRFQDQERVFMWRSNTPTPP